MKSGLCIFFLAAAMQAQTYVGSTTCAPCHQATYDSWKKTRMANIVQDPKIHPQAIVADFSKPNPLVTFTKDDVAFTYGSKWKQRYFKKVGNDYFVYPAQWDIAAKVWRAYNPKAGTDWWIPHYPTDQMQRPTGPLCDGCHSVNFNVADNSVAEWNVGCEKCHGPGSLHAAKPTKTNIVNPAKLDPVSGSDTCLQCHTQGQPKTNPINGKYYDWPVGYEPGKKLSDYWTLEEHKLGETTFTHFADDSAHKNRMQGNDFVNSRMHAKGITCFSCHNPHGTEYNADVKKPGNAMCLQCHTTVSPTQHSHHSDNSTGNQCIECHMPKIAQTIADVNVRSHTFKFITPTASEKYKIPNACIQCHKDQSNAWATRQLQTWTNFSGWRLSQ